jgi:hypothetical protein
MRQVIAILAIGALSSVAIADAPIVSATATSRAETREWVLSQEQVHELDAWLYQHRKDWGANFATPPTAAMRIQIKQSDGVQRNLEFFDQPGWSSAVIFHDRVGSFSATEIANLRQKLGERHVQ